MEEEEITDPLIINKDVEIIKDAQKEIGKLDVLVCGQCHEVFHFIEEFQYHHNKCCEESNLRETYQREPKVQVWAFLLWKNSYIRKNRENEKKISNESSWSVYQKWCKLDNSQKSAWIKAADYIQNNTKISTARIQELRKPNKATRLSIEKKDDDPLEEGEIRLKVPSKNKLNEQDPLESSDLESDLDTEEEVERELARIHGESDTTKSDKKTNKPVLLNSDVTIPPSSRSVKKALRTNTNKELKPEEYVVEKIVSKRFIPRKKIFEYYIKWENFDSSQNTWEPASHLSSCRALVEEFEEELRKQRAAKAAKVAAEKKNSFMPILERPPGGGRPQRTSKQKALKQVRTWCGDISESDEGSKRKSFSDDDSNDSLEKRIKTDDIESSDDESSATTYKSPLNGVPKKNESGLSETKVIRINEKQLPGLSSGVYVMSKTEGIIKLDSTAALQGGSLMKISPKIGQTRIKVVKKGDGTSSNILRVTSNVSKMKGKSVPISDVKANQLLKSGVTISTVKKGEGSIKMNIIEKAKSDHPIFTDDESDGLEELEFPTDLPLPEPESPPGEFTLDPLTGKLKGHKTPTPPPVPEPEPQESSDSPSLDNLVKLAAADLTEEDLKADDNGNINSSLETAAVEMNESLSLTNNGEPLILSEATLSKQIASSETVLPSITTASESSIELTQTIKEATIQKPVKTHVYSIVQNSNSTSSILSTALKNSNIKELSPNATPKKLLSTPNTVRQKVYPQYPTAQQSTSYVARVNTPSKSPYVQKVASGRGRGSRSYVQRSTTTPITSLQHEQPQLKRSPSVNTYRNTGRGNMNVARKIGHTTIYRTAPVTQNVSHTSNETQIILNADDLQEDIEPQILHQQHEPPVISMPLLTDDESQTELPTVHMTTTGESSAAVEIADESAGVVDISNFALADDENPIFITGEDGTIYQVAGQNEEGQTVLIAQGPDGQQQCVLIATEGSAEETPAVAETEATEDDEEATVTDVNTPLIVNTDESETFTEEMDVDENGEESQVVAQIIKADPPSPGGTRKVVLMLPDGNLMMTDVTAEQFAALELDK